MAKIGEDVPRLIGGAIDFMISSQAFMEYLKESSRLQHIPRDIPQDKEVLSLQRLGYCRQLYWPTCNQMEPESERRFLEGFL